MSDTTYAHKLEAAIVDVLDGNSSWYDIQANTGLDETRCKELAELFKDVLKNYRERNGV